MSKGVVLDLPWDIVDAGKGLTIDIGGSLIKILFLHKDDWIEPSARKEKSMGCLRLINFAREVFDKAVSDVKENCHIIRESPEETVQIFTTGFEGSPFKKTITLEFNVKTTNITEMDCCAHACAYLMKNISRQDILVDFHQPSFEEVKIESAKTVAMMEQVQKMSNMTLDTGPYVNIELHEPRPYTTDRDKPLAEEDGMFPCMVVMCGSQVGGIMMHQDGSFNIADGSNRGGRMFMGLGSLLTGAKKFEELMALAEKGNPFNVGLSATALGEGMDKDEESPYSVWTNEETATQQMAFYFGRAVGKTAANFNKEDIARCLLEMVLQDLANFAHCFAMAAGVKNVFFVGSFVAHPLVRNLLSKEWLNRDVNMGIIAQKPIGKMPFFFLKHGSHLGALGAYLNSKLHFFSDSGELKDKVVS